MSGKESLDKKRLSVVRWSLIFSLGIAWACSMLPGSNGWTAVGLNALNLTLFLGYLIAQRDRGFALLLLSASVFGLVELLADYLCVRFTGTLDYSVAQSWMIWESPWWMPLSWALVAIQVGVSGDAAIKRFGMLRGSLATGFLGALVIPFYEEMAWGANWWRYQSCLMLSHTPVYIIVAETIIAGGFAIWGHTVLRIRSPSLALLLGAVCGFITILGGILGWGLVEFTIRGMRPLD
jgi:hypothetical protein